MKTLIALCLLCLPAFSINSTPFEGNVLRIKAKSTYVSGNPYSEPDCTPPAWEGCPPERPYLDFVCLFKCSLKYTDACEDLSAIYEIIYDQLTLGLQNDLNLCDLDYELGNITNADWLQCRHDAGDEFNREAEKLEQGYRRELRFLTGDYFECCSECCYDEL
jgi:hypothetical protein